jgi:hypothetical protein
MTGRIPATRLQLIAIAPVAPSCASKLVLNGCDNFTSLINFSIMLAVAVPCLFDVMKC